MLLGGITNDRDAIVIKISSNGDLQWIKLLGGAGLNTIMSLLSQEDGSVVCQPRKFFLTQRECSRCALPSVGSERALFLTVHWRSNISAHPSTGPARSRLSSHFLFVCNSGCSLTNLSYFCWLPHPHSLLFFFSFADPTFLPHSFIWICYSHCLRELSKHLHSSESLSPCLWGWLSVSTTMWIKHIIHDLSSPILIEIPLLASTPPIQRLTEAVFSSSATTSKDRVIANK